MYLSSTCTKYTDTMHLVVMWPIAYTITVLHFIMLCARAAAGSLPVGKMLYCPRAVFCYTARPAMIILNKGLKIIQFYRPVVCTQKWGSSTGIGDTLFLLLLNTFVILLVFSTEKNIKPLH